MRLSNPQARQVPVSQLPTQRFIRLLFGAVMLAGVACTDEGTDMFNCYLAPDVPPVVVREESASKAAAKCEEEQEQECTCIAVRGYRNIVGPE